MNVEYGLLPWTQRSCYIILSRQSIDGVIFFSTRVTSNNFRQCDASSITVWLTYSSIECSFDRPADFALSNGCRFRVDSIIRPFNWKQQQHSCVRGRWQESLNKIVTSQITVGDSFLFCDFSSSISNNICLSQCVCGTSIDAHLHTAWINHSNFKCFL